MTAIHLPGLRSTLRISPLSRPLDIQGGYSAHGALSLILNRPHDSKTPNFAMVADERWLIREVHWFHPDAFALSDSWHRVELFGALRGVEIGPMRSVSCLVATPGRYAVEVETLTPLIIRLTKDRREIRRADPAMLIGAVQQSLRRCLGRESAKPFEGARMVWSVVESRHLTWKDPWESEVRGGLKLRATVETDAAGLTALRVLAELGMGSRTSRGYGRIRLARVACGTT